MPPPWSWPLLALAYWLATRVRFNVVHRAWFADGRRGDDQFARARAMARECNAPVWYRVRCAVAAAVLWSFVAAILTAGVGDRASDQAGPPASGGAP